MKTKSSKFIQRTAATLAALVFALVAGVCALSESKKVKAEYNNIYADTYLADYNLGYGFEYGYYSFNFYIDDDNLNIDSSYSCSNGSSDYTSILLSEESGDYWGDPTNFFYIIYSENSLYIHEIKSFSKNIKYNVSISEECDEYLENPALSSLKYVLIEYQIENENNESFTIEIYLNYSDSIKQYIEQQEAEQNAIKENENSKNQLSISIAIIIALSIGLVVLLFVKR